MRYVDEYRDQAQVRHWLGRIEQRLADEPNPMSGPGADDDLVDAHRHRTEPATPSPADSLTPLRVVRSSLARRRLAPSLSFGRSTARASHTAPIHGPACHIPEMRSASVRNARARCRSPLRALVVAAVVPLRYLLAGNVTQPGLLAVEIIVGALAYAGVALTFHRARTDRLFRAGRLLRR